MSEDGEALKDIEATGMREWYMVARRTMQSAWTYSKPTADLDAAKKKARQVQNRYMHQTVRLLAIMSEAEPVDFDVNTAQRQVPGW